jgi:hypothetical protein
MTRTATVYVRRGALPRPPDRVQIALTDPPPGPLRSQVLAEFRAAQHLGR